VFVRRVCLTFYATVDITEGRPELFCFAFEDAIKDAALYRHLLDGIVANTETLNQEAGLQAKIRAQNPLNTR